MALARSQSGPAGLSINTNSANSLFGSTSTTPATGGMFANTGASKPGGPFGSATQGTSAPQNGGLFGASTTQPASGGLFGSTATTTQPQTGGLFGSAATTTTQPQAGGLFGSTSIATTQAQTGGLFGAGASTAKPATGGLFGSTTTTTQPQTGGLFGSVTPATQPQTGGGLFGQPAATTQPQTGGLFGSATAAAQPLTSGGLFGSNTGGIQTGSSLFGGLNNQNQNKPATSLFGGLGVSQNQGQPQQHTMFAQSQNQGSGLLSGGLSLGQGNQQNPQTVPGVRIDLSNLRGTTRFNDLYDDLQQQVTQLDSVIQGQIKLKNDCDAIMPAHDQQLSQIPGDVAFCNRKLVGVEGALVSDVKSIAFARELVKVDAENAKLSFRAVDNLRLPPQYHNTGIWVNTPEIRAGSGEDDRDIIGFFSSTADELQSTLNKYQNNVSEIEQHLRGVEGASAQQINAFVARRNGSSGAQEDPVAELAAALIEFEQSILAVAGKVGGAREGVQNLQLGRYGASIDGSQANRKRSGVY